MEIKRLNSLNCAGQGCQERDQCRRYRVRVNSPACTKEHPFGEWGSFDVERSRFGDCRQFVKFRAS